MYAPSRPASADMVLMQRCPFNDLWSVAASTLGLTYAQTQVSRDPRYWRVRWRRRADRR